MGNDLARVSIAPGGGLYQLPVFVGQLEGQAVQLEHEQDLLLADKLQQRGGVLGLVQREERARMLRFLQRADSGIANGLRWGVCHADARLLFQRGQLVKEPVVFRVRH